MKGKFMRKRQFILTAVLALSALSGYGGSKPVTFDLEWNCKNDVALPYEIAIDRAKLDKMAGISTDAAIEVVAVTPQGEKNTGAVIIPGNTENKDVLRFSVPAGTSKLYAKVSGGKKRAACVNSTDNIVAGALTSPAKWNPGSSGAKIYNSGKNLRIDVGRFNWSDVKYTAQLPEGYAGTPAVFEVEVKSCSPVTWGGAIRVEQYDARGKLLPESLTEPRWISHMRAPGVKTHYQEYGFFHKDAKKIAVTFQFASQAFRYDNRGLEIKDKNTCLPKLEVSKLAIRKAQELPFPSYNNNLFADGISGKAGDSSLALDGTTIFHYSPNSHAVYSEAKQIKSDKECFWPLNDATVEAWVNPRWTNRESRQFVLLDARNNYGPRKKVIRRKIASLFTAAYTPSKAEWQITLYDGTDEHRTFKFKHKLELRKWSHVAIQYGKDGVECFINGKKVYNNTQYSFVKREYKKEFPANDQVAQVVAVGNTANNARQRMVAAPAARVDLVRISGNRRYDGDFTPAKSFAVDKNTYALFDFDRSIDGKTANGLGIVYGSLNSTTQALKARRFVCNNRMVQYYPEKLLDNANPNVVLNSLNYPDMPENRDFKAARRDNVVKYSAAAGSRKELTVPARSYMDYIEIACPDDVKELRHPVLIANKELDTRSFADIADSLNSSKVPEYERANIIFNLVLGASDYFMTHQADLPAHSNSPKHASYIALALLNSYCGFECGPLNNMTANMLACAGNMPTTQTAGYGHSFQQVYFDGKNHVYDLSAQMFFPGTDNETPASLKELDRENGAFQPWGKGGGASFSRQGFTRGYARHVPGMQERIAYVLHPGEKARFYFYNDGNYNDIQVKRCIDPTAVHPNDPFPYPAEFRLAKKAPAEVVSTEQLYQVYRPFPHYSNAYFSFKGKPSADNGAFKKITDKDFCYLVHLPYPIVAGRYKAVMTDGKVPEIEISTDGGKSFRKLVTDADGRATYAVRARHAYYIKVKAPISKVAEFDAYTEVMVNSRVQNCKLKEGSNSILFKVDKGEKADITIAYRNDVKEIVIEDAPYNGAMPGFERQITAVEPGKSVSHKVSGISGNAKVSATSGIDAALEDGKLTVTARNGLALPRFENVVINDNGAKKELVVLVSENVRLLLARNAKAIKGAKIVAASDKCVQDCAVVTKSGQQVTFSFDEIPAGDYTVWVLTRMNTADARARTSRKGSGQDLALVLPDGKLVPSITGRNTGTDLYKAQYGKGKGRFRWDAPIDNDHNKFPYFSPRWTSLGRSSSVTLQGTRSQEIEIAAVLITPRTDNASRSELVKVLCGLNCEPWKVAELQQK